VYVDGECNILRFRNPTIERKVIGHILVFKTAAVARLSTLAGVDLTHLTLNHNENVMVQGVS
jgi:hypothetical protein